MPVRITCINKAGGHHEDPHVAISRLGWVNEQDSQQGRSTRVEMYSWIVHRGGVAYVRDGFGNVAYLIGRVSARGNPFVQTVADGTPTDNLLRLGECIG
jgi:hypothetical protein